MIVVGRLHPFFGSLTEGMVEKNFLKDICQKYHYEEPQLPVVGAVAASLQGRFLSVVRAGRAGFVCGETGKSFGKEGKGETVGVCMTLGPGIDALQEDYLRRGLLSEAYMVETIASELLLRAYPLWNEWIREREPRHVKRYYFPGGGAERPLEALPELIQALKAPVVCTEAYCLLPKKSVAFYAELTEDADAVCEGICASCGNADCPNRMDSQQRACFTADMADRPFTYGYRRIFGLD